MSFLFHHYKERRGLTRASIIITVRTVLALLVVFVLSGGQSCVVLISEGGCADIKTTRPAEKNKHGTTTDA